MVSVKQLQYLHAGNAPVFLILLYTLGPELQPQISKWWMPPPLLHDTACYAIYTPIKRLDFKKYYSVQSWNESNKIPSWEEEANGKIQTYWVLLGFKFRSQQKGTKWHGKYLCEKTFQKHYIYSLLFILRNYLFCMHHNLLAFVFVLCLVFSQPH